MTRRIRIRARYNETPKVEKLARAIIGLAEQLRRTESAERPPEATDQEQAS